VGEEPGEGEPRATGAPEPGGRPEAGRGTQGEEYCFSWYFPLQWGPNKNLTWFWGGGGTLLQCSPFGRAPEAGPGSRIAGIGPAV